MPAGARLTRTINQNRKEDVVGNRIIKALATALALAAMAAMPGAALAQTKLKVMVFAGFTNLPLFAAQSQGYFAKRGLAVEILNTPNSVVLREGLAKGEHQIVHAGVDNAVAMADVAKLDIAVVMGGDSGLNQLFVQPEIKSYDDIRGKTVAVDAPDTAFGLLLYKMLALKGVKKGEYQIKAVGGTPQRIEAMLKDKGLVAAMLSPPFSIRAEKAGLKNMGYAVDVIGPYQSGAAWVMRPWAQANADVLTRYIQAYVEGLRWALAPANKQAAIALLGERLKLPQDIVTATYDLAIDPAQGFAKDAKFDLNGFRNVLKLRAEILGTWGGTPPAPDKYLDFSYYDKALAGL
jgi:ABC-type nitrate/sulfonate/bicarbonate transport system substrate-binding protein